MKIKRSNIAYSKKKRRKNFLIYSILCLDVVLLQRQVYKLSGEGADCNRSQLLHGSSALCLVISINAGNYYQDGAEGLQLFCRNISSHLHM